MASFDAAMEWVAPNEGGWTNSVNDKGGPTMLGLTLELAKKYGIKDEDELRVVSREKVEDIFKAEFWRFDRVNSQPVATKVFDCCVNMGLGGGVKVLQVALNRCGSRVSVDGGFGPMTLASTNTVPDDRLMPALCEAQAAHYFGCVEWDAIKNGEEWGWPSDLRMAVIASAKSAQLEPLLEAKARLRSANLHLGNLESIKGWLNRAAKVPS